MNSIALRCLFLYTGGCLAGCAPEGAASDDWPSESLPHDIGEVRSRSSAYDVDTWTAWPMPIDVCFTKFDTTNPSQLQEIPSQDIYDGLKALAWQALQESWMQVPSVAFVNRGDCSGSTSTFLHIELKYGPLYGGGCNVGVGAQCSV